MYQYLYACEHGDFGMPRSQISIYQTADWLALVERDLKRRYKIDFELAGLSQEEMARYFNPDQSPHDFVSWFAQKYDLIDFDCG